VERDFVLGAKHIAANVSQAALSANGLAESGVSWRGSDDSNIRVTPHVNGHLLVRPGIRAERDDDFTSTRQRDAQATVLDMRMECGHARALALRDHL